MKITTLVVIATIPFIFYSCKKDEALLDPQPNISSFKVERSLMLNNQNVVPPGTDTLFEWVIRATSLPTDPITLTNGNLTLSPTADFQLSTLRNVTVVIIRQTNEIWRQNVAQYAYTSIPFFLNVPMPSGATVDTIRVIAEVADPSARGGLNASLELGFTLPSFPNGIASSGTIPGQSVTYSSAVLSTSVGNPLEKLIVDNATDTGIAVTLTSNGQNISNPTLYFSSDGFAMVERITLYDGATAIAQTSSFSGNTASLSVNMAMPHGTTKNFVAKVTTKPITTQSQSRQNVGLKLSKVIYSIANGEVRTNDTMRYGNKLYVVKSYPRLEVLPVGNPAIINGVAKPFAHFRVTAVGGPVSWKQIEIQKTFGDQLPDSNLSLTNIRVFEGTIDRTGDFKIYNQAGEVDSIITESDYRIYITRVGGTNEDVVTTSRDYWIWYTPDGFANGAGDVVRVEIKKDAGNSINYNQLTLNSTGSQVKLRDASGSIIVPGFIWSDLSAGSAHSANTALSSNDFFDGSFLADYGLVEIFSR